MSIKRAPRPKSHYTIIANDVLRDSRLSFKARGLLACILSRPDNWRTTADDLARESKEGRSAILSGLAELKTIGYMTQNKFKNDKGHWVWESIVYDTPQKATKGDTPSFGFPLTDNPITDNPITDNPITDNRTILEDLIKKKDKEELLRTNDIEPHTYGDEIHLACNLLADLIQSNGSKRPKVSAGWLSDMEKLHRIDERTYEQITNAIHWCQADDFWRTNIMSPAKLRKQYDVLRLSAMPKKTKESAVSRSLRFLNESFNPLDAFDNTKAKEIEK